jgi:hypothetical protein
MAIVNVSLDTNSRQAVLTINGIIVPTDDVMIEKYAFDGEEIVRFSYTVESINVDGMKERRQFYLPSLEELATVAHTGLDDRGLSSKIIHDDDKAKADMIDFLKKRRNS